MDQAVLNATNYAASGISEGFKARRAQQVADQEQKYREKMDKFRVEMDQAKLELEKVKMQEQINQFQETYKQRGQMHGDQMSTSQTQFGYKQDEDARAEARWTMEQAAREQTLQLKQIELAQKGVKQVRALDAQGKLMKDGNDNPVYVNQPNVSVQSIVNRISAAKKPTAVSVPASSSRTRLTYDKATTPLYDAESRLEKIKGIATPTVKTSSHEYMYDIVARLRTRN